MIGVLRPLPTAGSCSSTRRAIRARAAQTTSQMSSPRLDPSLPNVVNMRIQHAVSVNVNWQSSQEGLRLGDYMTLPVEQFVLVDLPMGARMDRTETGFKLIVPRIELLNLWLEPSIEIIVELTNVDGKECVSLRSGKLDIRGPQWIDNIQDRIAFYGETQLTWDEGADAKISSTTVIEARADPPSPVNLVPKDIIRATVETVIQGIVNVLQKPFIESIANDYKKWASDSAYRDRRRGLAISVIDN